jgi:hypothetical protein
LNPTTPTTIHHPHHLFSQNHYPGHWFWKMTPITLWASNNPDYPWGVHCTCRFSHVGSTILCLFDTSEQSDISPITYRKPQ